MAGRGEDGALILRIPPGALGPAWENAVEIARVVDADAWVLIGGLMVGLHAHAAGLPTVRVTVDVDMLVQIEATSVLDVTRALERLDYGRHESLDTAAPFHRMRRSGGDIVDVMAPDTARRSRLGGRDVLRVAGGRSALRDAVPLSVDGARIRVPRLGAALALKGAAYSADSRDRERHLEDGITLLACLEAPDELAGLSKSMKANVDRIVRGLATDPLPWEDADPVVAARAEATLRSYRRGWART